MSEKSNYKSDNSEMLLNERMFAFFKDPARDKEVAAICKEMAEAENHEAMLWLARMYRDGKGVCKSRSKAIYWYKQSKEDNIISRFELLTMISGSDLEFNEGEVPEGLKIDIRKKDKLFVYKLNTDCVDLLVRLFPFTHYNVVGFTYEDEG